jgi:hypothetical protein
MSKVHWEAEQAQRAKTNDDSLICGAYSINGNCTTGCNRNLVDKGRRCIYKPGYDQSSQCPCWIAK